MIIEKIINNNIISSTDAEDREIIVMGRGIGFGKKPGQTVEENAVEKVFRIDNMDDQERFRELLSRLPLEYVRLSNDIISYAVEMINGELNQNLYLTLTDHISFAIDRFKEGMFFQNVLLGEVKRFYPREYLVGQYALRLIHEKTGQNMPEDEAASIALHLVNAEYNSSISDTFRMTKMIQEMVERIERDYPELKENCLHRDWLVGNLKYMAHRLLNLPPLQETGDAELGQIVRNLYPAEYDGVGRMNEFLGQKYECTMTAEEMAYLTININRTRAACLQQMREEQQKTEE